MTSERMNGSSGKDRGMDGSFNAVGGTWRLRRRPNPDTRVPGTERRGAKTTITKQTFHEISGDRTKTVRNPWWSPDTLDGMKVGVPSEIKNNEFRVAITPAGVHDLSANGHQVTVQSGAGLGSSITDDDYAAAGATIVGGASEVWDGAELLLKVKEPIESEYGYFRSDLV